MNQSITADLDSVMVDAIDSQLLTSLCTIARPSGDFDPGGAPDVDAPYVPVAEDIPCMMRPLTANETKDLPQVLSSRMKRLLLDGYYPDIAAKDRATVDGTDYDILGVESDSQRRSTLLNLLLVEI